MTAAALSVRNLSYTYPQRARPTLRDVSFDLPVGSWTVLVGPTGSGKSTLLKIAAGLLDDDSPGRLNGRVTLFGEPIERMSRAAIAGTLGIVGQTADDQICSTAVEAEVAFGLENLGLPPEEIALRIRRALAEFGLSELVGQPTHALSGGQKQRLVLAAILAMQPRVLLLDEPLGQLDAAAAADLLRHLERLRRHGTSILLAEHRLADVYPLADRVLALRDGTVESGVSIDPPAVASDATVNCGDGAHLRSLRVPHVSWKLCADQLSFAYPGQNPVWSDVSFALAAGESVALLGPNGSGKSTLLGVLAGLHAPKAGKLTFLGRDERGTFSDGIPLDEAPLAPGLVMQNPDLMLFNRTVRKELAFGPRSAGCSKAESHARVTDVAERLAVDALLDEDPLALSRGQRLRVALSAILTVQPRLVLLDEPATGQDPEHFERLMRMLSDGRRLAAEGRCLLFSTHDARLAARFATRVIVLADGRLLADGPRETVLADERLLRAAGLLRETLVEALSSSDAGRDVPGDDLSR